MKSLRQLAVTGSTRLIVSQRAQSVAAAKHPVAASSKIDVGPRCSSTAVNVEVDEKMGLQSGCPMMKAKLAAATETLKPMSELNGPVGWPIVGNFLTYLKKENKGKMHEVQARQHQMYGPIFREKWGTKWQVHVSEPRLIEEVYRHEGRYPNRPSLEPWILYRQITGRSKGLVTSQGREWHQYRAEFKHMLNPSVTRGFVEPIDHVTNDLMEKLRYVRDTKGEMHLAKTLPKEMHNWSMEAAGTFLFETRLGCLQHEVPERTLKFISALQEMLSSSLYLIVGEKLHQKLNTPFWRRHAAAWDQLFEIAQELVDERVDKLNDANDALSAAGQQPGQKIDGVYLTYLLSNKNINMDQIYSNVMEMLIGSTDTTANTFCFIAHLLANNPDALKRLRDEVESVLDGRRYISADDLDNMHYVKCVIKEGLRLFPPATMNCRILSEDIVLDGYLIPKQTLFVLNHYASARDSDVFPEPERFLPERWLRSIADDVTTMYSAGDSTAAEIKQHHAFGCLPFGYGNRSCLGRRVAVVELSLALAKTVQNFDLRVLDGLELQPTLRTLLTPGDHVPVRFVDRRTASSSTSE